MKKILIGGCSFSQKMVWVDDKEDGAWVSWTDMFQKEYHKKFKIINRAKSSFGQNRIVESLVDELVKHNFEIDYVLIQWSAFNRGYATNTKDFLEKMITQNELEFAPHIHEYIQIDKSFYTTSLIQIFLMKCLLEYKMIPYKMFWGWEQITPDIEHDNKDLLNTIYNNSFWRYKNNCGMREYIIDNIGENIGIIKGDFHPTTKGQEFFYNTIIKDILKEI